MCARLPLGDDDSGEKLVHWFRLRTAGEKLGNGNSVGGVNDTDGFEEESKSSV